MKESLLEKTVKLFSGIKANYLADVERRNRDLGKVDFGILRVAMMIAALDGKILPQEFAAFRKLSKNCKVSVVEGGALWDAALHSAGYILVQSGILTARQLALAFVREAKLALPDTFVKTSSNNIRRAFVMWISMGMSDGDFSGVERKCVEELIAMLPAKVRANANPLFMAEAERLLKAEDMGGLKTLIEN